MADIVISIVGNVAENLVPPVIREGKYFFCVQKTIKNLKNEKEELITERNNMLGRVQQVKGRGEIVEKPVEEWLNKVENILQEVADLEPSMEANSTCFQGRFPTFKRYRLCKQMVMKTKEIVELGGQSNIQPFSHPAPLPGIQYETSENFFDFESRKVAYNQLMEALQDDSCYMIGVYGMGGSGKTTLAKEVGKMAEQLNLFDKVISITVSQTPNIRSIQGKLADMLGLELKEESDEGRAQRIWLSLKEKGRILIIEDDLWGRFNLRDIGICLENTYKGRWKVLVTTRRKEICNSMECQKRIHLGLLSENESWALFKKHAKIDDDMSSKKMNDVPRKLCKECKGLPIAITAVGSSLKGKSNIEWEVALSRLMHSEATDDDMEEGLRDVYSCLKLSYDYLRNKEAELLFFLCSMYPEDYEIPIRDLIRYAIGLGLGGRNSLESVRRQIQAGINKLLDSCLLLDGYVCDGILHVRMHDMVRDVALWIARRLKDHRILFNHDKPLGTEVMDRKMEDYLAISSWCIEKQISFELDAPNLQIFLLVQLVRDFLDLSHVTFKERDNKLMVFAVVNEDLDLSHVTFKERDNKLMVFAVVNEDYFFSTLSLSLPCSIKEWTNLQTLQLKGWVVGDISFITSLTQLEVLDLEGCKINELPIEMGRLKRLKMLDLANCRFQGKYNGAIGKCLQLEELYAYRCYDEYFSENIMDIVTHSKLHRFVIGHFQKDEPSGFQAVELRKFDMSKLRASGRNILQVAEVVHLSDSWIRGCKNVIPDLNSVVGGMNNLSVLRLHRGEEIECILDATSDSDGQVDASIPKLVELHLEVLQSLKELCRGPPQCFFEKLQVLYIYECPQLHTIFPVECNLQNLKILHIERCTIDEEVLFTMSVAQSLQQLEYLRIDSVVGLKHIIGSGRGYDSNTAKQLFIAPPISPFLIPNLKKLIVTSCKNVESLFPICCCVEGLVQLQEIFLHKLPDLKYVFGECDNMDHSSLQYHNQIMLPRLMDLSFYNLQNLIDMCPENYPARWPSPKSLTVSGCPKFTGKARLEAESTTS